MISYREQERFINSEKNKNKFNAKLSTKKSREEYLKNLIGDSRGNLSVKDDFYVRFMYATCFLNQKPIFDHEIKYFKIKKELSRNKFILVRFNSSEVRIGMNELAGEVDIDRYMKSFIEKEINIFKIKNPCPGDNYEVNHKKQFSEIYKEFLNKHNISFESDKEFVLSKAQQNLWIEYHREIISTDEGKLEWLLQDNHKESTRESVKRAFENENQANFGKKIKK